MEEEQVPNPRIHKEEHILNQDVYNIIKDDVTCKICEEILHLPARCRSCEYAQCRECLSLAGNKCPNCNSQEEFDSNMLAVQRSLDRLSFSCGRCGQPHGQAALATCDLRLCPLCNQQISADDFLHACRFPCWGCQEREVFTSVQDLKTHFARSQCRPRPKSDSNPQDFCGICASRCINGPIKDRNISINDNNINNNINVVESNDNENEKMDENEFYPNLNQNEPAVKHDKTACLDRKLEFAFDVLQHLLQQLAQGQKPDLQTAATRHQTGMLKTAQMQAHLNKNNNSKPNINAQERDSEESRITNMHLHEDSELRVVSRLNRAEIYDERSAALLTSHQFERTKVDSIEMYESSISASVVDDYFLRLDSQSKAVEIVNLWRPQDLISFELYAQLMKKVEKLAKEQNAYIWIKENQIPNDKMIIQMGLGFEHAGVLKGDGKVKLVGIDDEGQTNLQADKNRNIKQISLGQQSTGLLQEDGSVHLFGYNDQNQCPRNFAPLKKVTHISLGANHSGFLFEDTTVQLIGDNGEWQCTVPNPNANIKQLCLGQHHTGILRHDGTLALFGWNVQKQCDMAGIPNRNIKQISLRRNNTGILYTDGTVRVIGSNGHGQCNLDDINNKDVVKVSVGENHTGFLQKNNKVKLIGLNENRECSISQDDNKNISDIECGSYSTMIKQKSNKVKLLGQNIAGIENFND